MKAISLKLNMSYSHLSFIYQNTMHISYVSIFPEIFEGFLNTSLIKKAVDKKNREQVHVDPAKEGQNQIGPRVIKEVKPQPVITNNKKTGK